MLLDKPKIYALALAAIVLTGLLATQTFRLHNAQQEISALQLAASQKENKQVKDLLAETNKIGVKLSIHANDTQGASDEFNRKERARAAEHAVAVNRAQRMQLTAERRAATYRAQAKADEAARLDLANRLIAFDQHIVEGVKVVGELRDTLERRDNEVARLRKQIDIDREVLKE